MILPRSWAGRRMALPGASQAPGALRNQSGSAGIACPCFSATARKLVTSPMTWVGSTGVARVRPASGTTSPVGRGPAKRSPAWTCTASPSRAPRTGAPSRRKRSQRATLASRQPELGGEAEPLDLPGRTLRDLGDDQDAARDLELGEAAGGELPELALGRLLPVAEDHRGRDLLAQLVVGHGEGHRLLHGGVIEQHLVHLDGRDLLAAAVDELLEPSGESQVPLGVDHALVAGAEPAVGEGPGVRLRVGL